LICISAAQTMTPQWLALPSLTAAPEDPKDLNAPVPAAVVPAAFQATEVPVAPKLPRAMEDEPRRSCFCFRRR
jgi:hypothetical protein